MGDEQLREKGRGRRLLDRLHDSTFALRPPAPPPAAPPGPPRSLCPAPRLANLNVDRNT